MILNLLASFALLRRVSSLPAVGSDDQVPLGAVAHHDASPAPRELTGNFLHISGIHALVTARNKHALLIPTYRPPS